MQPCSRSVCDGPVQQAFMLKLLVSLVILDKSLLTYAVPSVCLLLHRLTVSMAILRPLKFNFVVWV